LLVYLPDDEVMDEEEVLRRYETLKGHAAATSMRSRIAKWRTSDACGENLVREWLDEQRQRMYRVSEFMKILKQWFTVEYNRRHAHRGTLWEATYFDRIVRNTQAEIAKCLAYIHLNPIRVAAAAVFDGYAWSSYSAFHRGDVVSAEGMRFVYGGDVSNEEISSRHEVLMTALLEEEKLRRAQSIARKVAAGYEMPRDPLTTEAEVAQAAARLKELENEMVAYQIQRDAAASARARYAILKEETMCVLKMHPDFDIAQLLEAVSVPSSVLYRILADLKERGLVQRVAKGRYSLVGK
jgi:hypothetical protein